MVTLARRGLNHVAGVIINGFGLFHDRVAGDCSGVCIGGLVQIVACVASGRSAQTVVSRFGELLRTSRQLLDDMAGRIVPRVIGKAIPNRPGGGIHSVTNGLINAAPVVELRLAFRDQIAGGRCVKAFGPGDSIEIVERELLEEIDFAVGVRAAVSEVVGECRDASGRAIDVLSLLREIAVSAIVTAGYPAVSRGSR